MGRGRSTAQFLLPLLPILVLFVLVGAHRDAGAAPAGDESDYLAFAHNLTHGYFANRHGALPVEYLWHGPGTPLVLVPFVEAGASLRIERLTGPIFLFLAAVLLHRWLRMYVSNRGALLATYAFALYYPFYELLGQFGPDALAVLMTVAVGYTTTLFLRTGALRYRLLAAGSLAFLAMTRLEYGFVIELLVVAASIWFAVRRAELQRRVLSVAAIALLLCVPWLVYTYDVSGRVSYWSNAGGLSLYWMAASEGTTLGDWHSVRDVQADPRLAGYKPFFASLTRKPPLEQDRVLQDTAIDAIRAHPGRYVRNLGANVSRLTVQFPYSFASERTGTAAHTVPAAVLLALVGLSVIALAVTRVRLPVEVVPLSALAVLAFAIHVPAAAYPRFAFPAIALAIWFVAVVLPRTVALVAREGAPRARGAAEPEAQ